jgi:hypothetical protein
MNADDEDMRSVVPRRRERRLQSERVTGAVGTTITDRPAPAQSRTGTFTHTALILDACGEANL